MASHIHHNNCLCCGSEAISKEISCKDYTVSAEVFEIWKCNSCSFCFTQNVPSQSDIGRYYQSNDYISHTDTKEGLVNRLYHIVRKYTLKSKTNLIKKVTGLQQGSLLDIGAGTGAFCDSMKQSGWHVTGLEPDNEARKIAEQKFGLTLQALEKFEDLQKESYDAITLWHVLEHVHDLHGYFQKFIELLKSTGRLIIAVPNYTSHDAHKYGECWAAYDVPRHLYHFSPKSMEVLLNAKGLVLESIHPMWFDSFYVSMLSEKYKHGKDRFFPALVEGIKSNLQAFKDRNKCSSVIYVIRKK